MSTTDQKGRTGPKESVWDYPRPPRIERLDQPVRVELGSEVVAASERAFRILETSSPPTIYLPPDDVRSENLRPVKGTSFCEWKGTASYLDAIVGQVVRPRAAWTYRDPNPAFAEIRDWIAFYPGRVDAAFIGDEQVRPQPGNYYGGWITDAIEGPFKGEPGTEDW